MEAVMVVVPSGQRAQRTNVAHPDEWISILLAIGATFGAIVFFWLDPAYQPTSHIAWAVPGWIAGAYLFTQILFLLVSATQIRAIGVLDSFVAILPVVAGLVMAVEWLLGHLALSLFQINAMFMLIATSLAEFLLTVWIRFVINRRTISVDGN
jgi:hypothetical protein